MPTSLGALKAAIAGGKALLVCGAGVSRAVAGDAAKGWEGLIDSAIDAAPKEPSEDWSAPCKANLSSKDPDLWLSAADIAQKKLGGVKAQQFRAWLKESVGDLRAAKPALLDAIKGLGCRLATTNYDGLLCTHMGVQPKTWRNPDAVAEILSGESSHVWHIHGNWDDPESVIFSNADYHRVRRSDRAQFLQQHAAFADTLIFLGCSADGLADQNIGKLLEWFGDFWGGLGKKHFAVVTESDVNAPGWPPAVIRVPYGLRHDALPTFLRSLANTPPQASDNVNRLEPLNGNQFSTPKWERALYIVAAVLGIVSFVVSMWGLFPASSYSSTNLNGSMRFLWVGALGVSSFVLHVVLWRCAEVKYGWNFSSGGLELPTGWQAAILSATITLPLVFAPLIFQLLF